jgi:oligoribonuclease NrnB/cAMP/cGMP phosphodiesterase (DHH superfamily)
MVQIIAHEDADGICSAALAEDERSGFKDLF